MPDVEEVRSELGGEQISELLDAYYGTDLSLKEIKELFAIPQAFTDQMILELLPLIELSEYCPVCNMPLYAKHISRGVRDCGRNSYYESEVFCPACKKTLPEISKIARRGAARSSFGILFAKILLSSIGRNLTGMSRLLLSWPP